MSELDALRSAVGGRQWYHTIELAPGVETPGWFDTRPVAAALPFPDLRGRRCLDVGTFDGFWALTMLARGASDVLAIDVIDPEQWDWPEPHERGVLEAIAARKRGGDGFRLVMEATGADVERRELSVYDLHPDVVGRFDFVYVGSLLLHLRDPVRALMRARDVLAPGGQLLLVDAIDTELTLRHPWAPVARLDGRGRPWWWRPNKAGLARMVESAGWRVVRGPQAFRMPRGEGMGRTRPGLRALLSAAGRQVAIEQWLGDPHCWVLAEPVADSDASA